MIIGAVLLLPLQPVTTNTGRLLLTKSRLGDTSVAPKVLHGLMTIHILAAPGTATVTQLVLLVVLHLVHRSAEPHREIIFLLVTDWNQIPVTEDTKEEKNAFMLLAVSYYGLAPDASRLHVSLFL